ncbi:MAG TPA: flagellar hook protein FlgE [Syntrophomonadaceae bacterium]|nr:flagellar hook protein FlgE [Syntrophomonadaceae bacterium]
MMRSLSSAVSGLKTMQTEMDVIGNNMANVNTPGFKKSRVVFQDALYQAMSGGSAPGDTRGGTNPAAIGMGTGLASVDQITTGSSNTTTNSPTDLAVDGDGYFAVKGSDGTTLYTRAGAFKYDASQRLVDANGSLVQGWLADNSGAIDTSVSKMTSINLASYNMIAPKATTEMNMSGNLDATSATNTIGSGVPAWDLASSAPSSDSSKASFSKEYYDSLGVERQLYFRFFTSSTAATPPVTTWNCDVSTNPDFTGAITAVPAPYAAGGSTVGGTLRFEGIKFTTEGKLDPTGPQNFTLKMTPTGADPITMTVDLTSLTQYDSESTADVETQDGYSSGTLSSKSVGTDGIITGIYDNGQKMSLARVALANFRNPSGLEQVGSNLFRVSTNSGDAKISAPGNSGAGTIMPSNLESSNVDLSEELTNMIVAQRGFSANSRIITVSDQMLQELVNLGK